MTKSKRLIVLVAAAAFVAACGSDGEPRHGGGSVAVARTTAVSSVEEVATRDEAVERIVIWADEVRVEPLRSIAPDFTDATGLDVEIVPVPMDEIRSLLRRDGPVGDGPDLFVGAHEWTGELAADGLIDQIDVSLIADSFLPIALDGFNFEGRNYAIPFFAEAVAMFRNSDLVAIAPTSWDDLRAACDVRAVQHCLVVAGGGDVSDAYHTYPFGVSSLGGDIFAFDEATGFDPGQVALDSPEALDSAIFLEQQVDEGYISSTTSETAKELWLGGDAAFWVTDPDELQAVRSQTEIRNWDVSLIPQMGAEPARPFVVATGFFVSAFSEQRADARTFLLDYIATDETMQLLYEADPRGTAWATVQASLDRQARTFGDSAADGTPIPNIPQMADVWEPLGESLLSIRNGETPAAEALSGAAASIRASLAS